MRCEDILGRDVGEDLAALAVDVHVDGGPWGDGRPPAALRRRSTWLSLLRRTAGPLVVNLGSTTRGLEEWEVWARPLLRAAEQRGRQAWWSIYNGSLLLLCGSTWSWHEVKGGGRVRCAEVWQVT